MKQRNLFNLNFARTTGMLSGARRVATLLLLTLLTTATAWADAVTFTLDEKQANGDVWPAGKVVGVVQTSATDKPLSCKVTTTGTPFKFKKGTNQLIVADGSQLDYETKTAWTFNVSATDDEQSFTMEVTVNLTDVNEAPQQIIMLSEYPVDENTATGKTIGTFEVFDPDAGDALTYSLTGVLTGAIDAATANKNLSDIFVLKETKNANGQRTVAINVKNSALLDYEKLYIKSKGNATYQATVTVTDAAGLSVTKTTNIAIKDVNEKVSAKGGTFYLNEHSPIGSPVSAVQYKDDEDNPLAIEKVARVEGTGLDIYSDIDVYTDNDAFNTLTYQIVPGKNTGTDYTKFTVDPNTGVLYTNADFDYESGKKRFSFIVTVSDGDFTADADVVVYIDNVEEPINLPYDIDATVEENTAEDETVVDFTELLETIKAENDYIRGQLESIVGTINFSIDQDASDYAKDVFYITTTGIIKVADPTKLNFEALYSKDSTKDKSTFRVVVVASGVDENDHDVNAAIIIEITVTDVNEEPEITNATPLSVPESFTSKDGTFGKVTATDPDNAYGSIHLAGFNMLTYKVDEVLEVDGSTEFPFELDPNTGAFTVADGKKLDYTKQKQYQCRVAVMDNPRQFNSEGQLMYHAQSATKTIIINVTDVNEPSEFKVLTNLYEVEENVDKGTELDGEQIVVYDEDDADIDALKISITDKDATATIDAANLFEVVQVGRTDENHLSTFAIKTKAGLDYESLYKTGEKDAVFNVTLTVTDTQGWTTNRDTQIRVIDVNEKPQFTSEGYSYTVMATEATERVFDTKVNATDPDTCTPDFGTITYSLEGDDAEYFDIDPTTGEINLINYAKLDYKKSSELTFYAVASDRKNEIKVPVTITLTRQTMNENDITIEPSTYTSGALLPVVKDGNKTLVSGTDYTAVLPDGGCINAGQYTITITGDGNYTGEVTDVFVVNPRPITADGITVLPSTYTGKGLLPVIMDGETTLVSETDYMILLPNDGCTNVGDYSVSLSGIGNYTGDTEKTFTIVPQTVGLNWSETIFNYDGTEKSVTATATGLKGDDVCTVTLTGNTATAVGTYTATATALSNSNYQLPATGQTCDFVIVRTMENLFSGSNVWTGYVAQEDLALPDGLTAYTVTALDDKTATATEIRYIPKDEPVLLRREDKTVNNYVAGPYEGTEAAPTGNLLRAATASSQPTAYRDYLLYRDAFVLSGEGTLATGKVFLPAAQGSQSRTATRSIIIDGDGTTAISTTDRTALTDEGSAAWFDMLGRRYDSKPTRKGLYVRNGKKVVIK